MTGIPDLPPALFLIAGAVLLPLLSVRLRAFVTVAVPLLALVFLARLDHDATLMVPFAGVELILLQVSDLNFVFGVIFLLISAIASLYAWHLRDLGQQIAAMLYGAGAVGVTFAGDFLALLLFWELMALASAWLVFARQRSESTAAGFRYLLFHVVGGSILFGGIILLHAQTGTLQLRPLTPDQGFATWLILLGIGVNVGIPPFHPWLPDAYPRATETGAVFMSALTTKSAVFALLILFPGWSILVYGGALMTLYGTVYALLANDIRRILSYSIISQVGYMVVGVGIGTDLSIDGTIAHAYSHILYKALLFMGAGAIIHATGKSRLTELGGLGGRMPMVFFLFMIGTLAISGFPLLNGFVSKSMIVSAAGEAHYGRAAFLLHLASAGTFLHTGLRLPYYMFGGRARTGGLQPVPRGMYAAMALLAGLCIAYGIAPDLLYRMLPRGAEYHPFTMHHLVESLILLALTFAGFWLLRSKLKGRSRLVVDSDWIYRRLAPHAERLFLVPIESVFEACADMLRRLVDIAARHSHNPHAWLNTHRGSGSAFDPDIERPPLANSLALILLSIAVLALLVLLG